jgi:hypothetical protein
MSRIRPLSAGLGLTFVILLAGVSGGCGTIFQPPPEAILSGTWSLTSSSIPGLTELLLIFDRNGHLTDIEYRIGSDVLITAPAPTSSTTVDGTEVSIAATFLGNSLTFHGLLNDSNTVITGSISTRIDVGIAVITINDGPATMTKQ